MKHKLLLFSFCTVFMAGALSAQMNILHNFTNQEYPYGSLTISGNVLYGLTSGGGANNQGYVFSMNKDGSGYKDLWNFYDTGSIAGNCNGAQPRGSLLLIRNKLYGTTYNGGLNNQGCIFSINTNGTGFKDMWDFTNATGVNPYSGQLLLVGNKLYGTATENGAHGYGCIFSIDTNSNNYTDIYDFASATGGYPYAGLVISGKTLFGNTQVGGTSNEGVIFSVDTAGHNYKIVLNFDYANGGQPYNSMVLSANGTRLFGTTPYGGSGFGDGEVFGIDTSGNNFKNIFFFNNLNGDQPYGQLALVGGRLFGTTEYGSYPLYEGTLYAVDTTGNNFNEVYAFDATHGANPYFGALIITGDTIMGMTEGGGSVGYGTIFSYINSPAGIQNPETGKGDVMVYPNPSSGQFTIKLSVISSQLSETEVYNMMGQKVYSQPNISNSTFNIDLGNQASGIYLYRVISQDGGIVGEGKMVIQK